MEVAPALYEYKSKLLSKLFQVITTGKLGEVREAGPSK